MTEELEWIIQLCDESENKHLKRFAKLIGNHMDGIVSHTEYQITSGRIEGINNKIKTIRRMHYGLPDDDYFFITLLDINKKFCTTDPLFKVNGPIVFENSSVAA